jgi:hypothetical protein
MPAGRDPLGPDHHRNRVIESKRDDGRASAGCAADNPSAVLAPQELPRLALTSRIEQSYLLCGERIEGARLCRFEAVAHSTRKSEIPFVICSAG